ncbi:MAG: biotin--[acetyl-CoA-carboxylase] ligase [Caldilineae bacterium]|nr:MAG: biotin--[acetyl-CoA-carboxylase] ligase [Caldilineae bacterium]
MNGKSQGKSPDAVNLDARRVEQALAGQAVGHTLLHRVRVPSTMPLARELAERAAQPGDVAGAVVVAEEQTAGRGRLDRRWDAPPGQALLSSTLLAGSLLPPRPAQMVMIAGLAVLEAIRQVTAGVNLALGLKWPNDVVVQRPRGLGKLAGILVEAVHGPAGLRYAVLGIGVNVNQSHADLPAPARPGIAPVSLHTLTGRIFSREELLIRQCRALSQLLAPDTRPAPAEIQRRWEKELIHRGAWITVVPLEQGGPPLVGRIVGVTLDGALRVEDADGVLHTVFAGDVTMEERDGSV